MKPEDAAKLRAPFPDDAIEHKNIGSRSFAYINHAVVTDRLIEVDPAWYWQPISVDPNTGMPLLDNNNGLWIRLTVCGVSRIGYGASEPHQKGADAIKTAISDAIKNAAMRFGVALDLWGADANGTTGEALTPFTLRSVPPVEELKAELQAELKIDPKPEKHRIEDPKDAINVEENEPHCKHGERSCRVYRTGTSNTGKPYEGLFCQRKPYSEQCSPLSTDGRPWKK